MSNRPRLGLFAQLDPIRRFYSKYTLLFSSSLVHQLNYMVTYTRSVINRWYFALSAQRNKGKQLPIVVVKQRYFRFYKEHQHFEEQLIFDEF